MLYKTLMFMSWLVRCLPYDLLLFIGKILGNIYYLVIKKQRNRAIEQMMPALKISESEAKKLVRASFVNLARNMLDILYMPNLKPENVDDYVEIVNRERIDEAINEGHGIVVVTGHIGTWEWMSGTLALKGYPVTAIAKMQPNAEYSRALDDLRATVNVEIFTRGTSELLSAGRALKKGKILGFLADQDGGPGGAFIEFLGRTASTPMGAAVFARKFNSPVLPMFIIRQPNGRHKIIVHEIIRYEDSGDTDNDLYNFTEKMTRIIEAVIKEYPTQWLWFQKRWNTPPEMQKKNKHHTVKSLSKTESSTN